MYLSEESIPEEKQYIWAYCVIITNYTNEPVTLQSRHWNIIDGNGYERVVDGEGVVGEKPVIIAKGVYSYTSGAMLRTPSGLMFGFYGMESDRRGRFDVIVPAFSLDSPHVSRIIH